MKTLLIIRHAKSDWNAPSGDYYRPLTHRGTKDADSMAAAVADFLPSSYAVWSSAAKRASQTAVIFANRIGITVTSIDFREDLYTFDSDALAKVIKSCSNAHDALIVFGHNSAITDFVNKFGDIYIDDVPTSGFVSITFDANDWSAITQGKTGKTIFSRDLKS